MHTTTIGLWFVCAVIGGILGNILPRLLRRRGRARQLIRWAGTRDGAAMRLELVSADGEMMTFRLDAATAHDLSNALLVSFAQLVRRDNAAPLG